MSSKQITLDRWKTGTRVMGNHATTPSFLCRFTPSRQILISSVDWNLLNYCTLIQLDSCVAMPENVEIKAKVTNVHDLTNKAKTLSGSGGTLDLKLVHVIGVSRGVRVPIFSSISLHCSLVPIQTFKQYLYINKYAVSLSNYYFFPVLPATVVHRYLVDVPVFPF